MNSIVLRFDAKRSSYVSIRTVAILTFALWSVIVGCSTKDNPATDSQRLTSHERMRAILKEIADRTPEEHPFLSEKRVRHYESEWAKLGVESSQIHRANVKFQLGKAHIHLNHLQTGIDHLFKAYQLLPSIQFSSAEMKARSSNRIRYQLALAYLRLGETENCCLRHSGDSCIVPIQGDGLHTRQEGSRQAIKYFLEVLNHASDDMNEQVEIIQPARWLLNIAYMTINGYPNDVPKEYLIPPHVFQSDIDFPRFKNIYPKLGLNTYNLSGGAIVDDFNGDGYLDIMTSTWDTTGQTQYFRNNRDGSFMERTVEAGLSGFYGGLNMVQADYDNDGDMDVYIVRGAWLGAYGRHPNSLLRNNGDETFTDVTFDAGLGEFHFPAKTAAWSDYDNDGDLDLYVGNESTPDCPCPSQLFRNNGNGTFTDVAADAGLKEHLFAMGAVWGDYNQDRYPDLFVSVSGAHRLYRNNRNGTFTNLAEPLGITTPNSAFPAWFWDFDNDGVLDLYVGCSSGNVGILSLHALGVGVPAEKKSIRKFQEQTVVEFMALYRGDGRGGFKNVAKEQKLNYPSQPMGANFGDLNGDGYLDFYLGTGNIQYSELRPNVMFLNQQGQSFDNVTMAGGFGHLQKGHGVSFADLDNDGDQDVYIQMGGAYLGDKYNDALFENPGFGNHWITIQLVGQRSNRCAIGTRICAEIVENGVARSVYRHVNSGGSFGCNPLRQTIGLGSANTIHKLKIFWPTTNQTQVFENVPVDQIIRVVEGEEQITRLNLKKLQLQTGALE